jgi:hypothetical protein
VSELPPTARPPDATDQLRITPRKRAVGSTSPAGVALANAVAAMNRAGDNAEDEYQRALDDLRRQADAVIVEIAREANDCDEGDYPTRWALVHLASELRDPAALPFLRNLVQTPIPPERSKDPHSFSSVAEETIMRTTAVEGVAALAAERQSKEAAEALWEFLKQPSLSVRRAAVQSIYHAVGGGKRVRDRIAGLLPDDQRFLIDLKPVAVTDVPQITRPQRHLSESGRQGRTDPPPAFPGGDEDIDEPRSGPKAD